MTSRDMHRWRADYDAAGIRADSIPPASTVEVVRSADLVIASDMRRAIESAERLTSGPVEISPLVRETPTPFPEWTRIRMPRRLWDIATGIRWGWWVITGTEALQDDWERVTKAVHWLDDVSNQYEHIAVVCHGNVRRLLAIQLVRLGWRGDGHRRSYRHWTVWTLLK